jgi:hypothetical protein
MGESAEGQEKEARRLCFHLEVVKKKKIVVFLVEILFFRIPYSIHSSFEEILELVRRVRPVRVVPIVADSPCPFELLGPLLDVERLPPCSPPPEQAKPQPRRVLPVQQERKVVVVAPVAARRSKRIGVSDERAAEIAEQIARNGQRLGVEPFKRRANKEKKEHNDNDIEILD